MPTTATGNLNFVAGDLLQHIPSADAILMKLVLHAFSDEDCIKILKKCREAIPTEEIKYAFKALLNYDSYTKACVAEL
ncbi:hypothetical protein V6N13_078199 [Hibiscus sabdariffa]